MRPVLLLSACLALVACSPSPFVAKGECHAEGWGPIYTEDARPCTCLVRHAKLALSMLRQAGISESMSGTTTWIHKGEDGFTADDGSSVDGLFEFNAREIIITRWGDAWVHEALHYTELLRGVDVGRSMDHAAWATNTWNDPNWGERNWWDLTGLYWEKVNPYDGGEACP